MTDCLSQQFLILQWITFNSIINQIQAEDYSILINGSQKGQRELSHKGSKLPYSSQGPLQKKFETFTLVSKWI